MCNGYSTGDKFNRALAEALQAQNENAMADLEAIKNFIYQHTGFRVTSAYLKGHNEFCIKGLAKGLE